VEKFKTGILVYSGCTETVNYDEAEIKKGFYYIEVNEKGEFSPDFIELESTRQFVVIEHDFSGLAPSKIAELASNLVKEADRDGIIIIPILNGILSAEASRAEVDIAKIRNAAEKALLVHPIVLLRESEVSEEIVRSIFESKFKDLKTKAFEYFLQIFSERYHHEKAKKIAYNAVNLIEPLIKKQDEKVKQIFEELIE
jgi:hypothetical protein